jgi:hypothetical protein
MGADDRKAGVGRTLVFVLGGLGWLVISLWAWFVANYHPEAGGCEWDFDRIAGMVLGATGWISATAGLLLALTDPGRAGRWGFWGTVGALVSVAGWVALWPATFGCA